ncbi:plastocyanin/azurin family copper-binding protein [Nocardia sp. NBC_00565]|uniref:cupredoxin domain-containing protein n=1 Tax=Nocardia sp. NBC_00565 TaxID=2975993 RepID=UPI002E804027|nr:plastocyanin/azurin family copper-binding protein [Nocardia sp. NBC_00565]WUC02948.1 plastocyanin/azurin family copper-binding protein [Nocardia sp. NBC_00565]
MSPQIAAGFVLAATLLLSGCGSGEPNKAASTTAKTTSQAASSTPGEKKTAAVTVGVQDMKFSPAEVTVKVGDTVTWKFKDSVPHTVQGIGDKAMGINSPIFDKGEWSYTFFAPGTYRYLCSLHPQMRGTVTVE